MATILSAGLLTLGSAGAARAQSAQDGAVVDGIMESLGLKRRPTPAPDFVERSRPAPDALHYVPVGPPRSDAPTLRTMTPAEVAAATEAIDLARTKQQRGAGLRPVPVPRRAAAATIVRKANR